MKLILAGLIINIIALSLFVYIQLIPDLFYLLQIFGFIASMLGIITMKLDQVQNQGAQQHEIKTVENTELFDKVEVS